VFEQKNQLKIEFGAFPETPTADWLLYRNNPMKTKYQYHQ
jgi:hypothetical protein